MSKRLETGEARLVRWEPGDGTCYELAVAMLPDQSRRCGGNLLAAPINCNRFATAAFCFGGWRAAASYYIEKWGPNGAAFDYGDVYIYRTMLAAAAVAHAGVPEEDEPELIASGLRDDHNVTEWARDRFASFDISTIEVHRAPPPPRLDPGIAFVVVTNDGARVPDSRPGQFRLGIAREGWRGYITGKVSERGFDTYTAAAIHRDTLHNGLGVDADRAIEIAATSMREDS